MIQLTHLLYSRLFFCNVSCYSKLKILECVAFLQLPLQIFHLFQTLISKQDIGIHELHHCNLDSAFNLSCANGKPVKTWEGRKRRKVFISWFLEITRTHFLKGTITAVFNEVNYTWISFLPVFITSLPLSLGPGTDASPLLCFCTVPFTSSIHYTNVTKPLSVNHLLTIVINVRIYLFPVGQLRFILESVCFSLRF